MKRENISTLHKLFKMINTVFKVCLNHVIGLAAKSSACFTHSLFQMNICVFHSTAVWDQVYVCLKTIYVMESVIVLKEMMRNCAILGMLLQLTL